MNRNRINMESEIVLSAIQTQMHGRAISKALALPLTTVQRHLSGLIRANVLDSETVGRNRMFRVKKTLAARQAVYSAEHYRLAKLIEKYPGLAILIEDILENTTARLVILYGSYAGFSAKKESDIDIYLETDGLKPKKTLEALDSRLSVKTGEFMKGDPLIKEVIRKHIILRGVEDFYERLGVFGKAKDGEKA